MPILQVAAVVFVGVAGGGKVDAQVASVLESIHVQRATMSQVDMRTLARREDAAAGIVAKLHVDGVVGGELVVARGHASLHMVIYRGDGTMASYNESPIARRVMSATELDVLRFNLTDDLDALKPHPAPAPEPVAAATPDASGTEEPDVLARSAERGTAPAASPHEIHIGADLGLGVAERGFSSGSAMVRGYSSSPVPTGRLGLTAEAFDRFEVRGLLEHTLTMNTALADGPASTSVSRWELEGSYAILRGSFELRARAGIGHRGFAMDTSAAVRSPDGDYTYGILGASVGVRVTDRVRLEGGLAYEPVFGGSTPTMGMFGADGRVAFDVGIGAVIQPTARTFVRAAFDYQRFSWDLLTTANAPVGSASDGYPSGTLSLGGRY